ncbi:MAG: RagB/SusD family nutrient uptake outer membrane protein [Prolixibacteraceae bacterium]
MKKHIIYLISSASLIMAGCLNDEYLEKYPLDQQTEETAFVTYDNFKTYTWGLYEELGAYANQQIYAFEQAADNCFWGAANGECDWAWQKVTVVKNSGEWNYDYIRRVNVMLDNVDNSVMIDAEKDHWRGVGLFFRSFRYYKMLAMFGDLVWVEHALNDKSPELYAPRDSRDLVAQNILRDLQYAEQHIKQEGDGVNTITPDVVKALISRFCLFEGTWRKYHGLNDAGTYLAECRRVSAELVEKYPTLHSRYDDEFCSADLTGMTGILLFRQYELSLSTHQIMLNMVNASSRYEFSKDAVDSYLCKDGRPITNSSLFKYPDDEKDPYTEFQDRDIRLLYTVAPPYRVATPPQSNTKEWWHIGTKEGVSKADSVKYASYFPVMERISETNRKMLPIRQPGGNVVKFIPHFNQHNGGFTFMVTEGGYRAYKHLTYIDPFTITACSSDMPLFRMSEVMLNYAEVMWELGGFDQDIANKTINQLRKRAEVADMVVTDITASFDPNRDPAVDPVLWEIRRERRVELMADGFRFDDIRRWKKGEYANKQKLGRWYSKQQLVKDGVISKASQCKLKFKGGGDEGYIEFFGDPVASGYGWKSYYYLYPLPYDDLALNPALEQNPGWE